MLVNDRNGVNSFWKKGRNMDGYEWILMIVINRLTDNRVTQKIVSHLDSRKRHCY